ncbi:aminotransferase class V-fold PLP-dependent enzyme [Nocardioides sp. TRM66260-LWL]|uniref:cysteine desulfurase family protein n=1 Tax=Nocardioides sp. TRM66260-LWL TaxID=2874478 RepID=UPI001CC5972E|nr:aminotransferase class V-fold PLP-dependent enzyme [Nocardioides sp. TRM66260-LWL]MBZ5734333.1 aminotransferase class V-fold PLP-dependent enzyme [Nocardioides sp. TRM66260-LWL]
MRSATQEPAPDSPASGVSAARPYVYLDAASSEPLHPAAREVLLAALERGYADPRRLHGPARTAGLLLENAREVCAEALGLRREEVTFTGSGTEAVHRGLLGLRRGRARVGGAVVHSAVEHSAVLHALEWVGGEHPQVGVDAHGRVSPDAVLAAVEESTAVVALQAANHEVGTRQPVAEVTTRLGERADPVPVFVDACAAAGRVPLPEGWAVAAASAHQWGGPAGVGLLLVRRGARWRAPFPVDDRSDPRAVGFEDVPAALAAAAALRAVVAEREQTARRQHALVDRIRAAAAAIPDVDVVGDPDDRLPHLVTFSCLYVQGEALVAELDRRGFGVASGSACTASTLEPSHVLAAMGALTHGNVRVSLTRETTAEQVEAFCAVLPEVVEGLRP